MTTRRHLLFALSAALPLAGLAQSAGDALPLRNLQIEVRQSREASASAAGVRGQIRLRPGDSGVALDAGAGQRDSARELLQRALVLNGRAVAIRLGNSRPLRVPGGSWLIDSQSGFSARPLWRGGAEVELELSALLAAPAGNAVSASATSSVLLLRLDEWTLVAASDDSFGSAGTGPGGASQSAGREALRVEARISLR